MGQLINIFEEIIREYGLDPNDPLIANMLSKVVNEKKLRHCSEQLNQNKKVRFGFNPEDSVIDVEQGGYAISDGDDILYTYGIGPCCGVVLYDSQKSILFHLDGNNNPEVVINIINEHGFNNNSMVLICPGPEGKMDGAFEHNKLEQILNESGYNVSIQKLGFPSGYIAVDKTNIRFNSPLGDEILSRAVDRKTY